MKLTKQGLQNKAEWEAKGYSIQSSIFRKPLFMKKLPHWTKADLVQCAITILYKIKYLHDNNILIGDINPNNFLVVSPQEVYLVDTDSFQINDLPCPVGFPLFTAPEIHQLHRQGKFSDYSEIMRTRKNEYFAVALPDDVFINDDEPVISQLIKVHEKMGGSVIALEEVAPENVSRYGIVKSQFEIEPGLHKIIDMTEKPRLEDAPSNLAIMGRYVLSPTIFEILKDQQAGTGGEIQLTDAIKTLCPREPVWGVVYNGRRFDCGTQKGWLAANVQLAMDNPELREVILKIITQSQYLEK